MNPRKTAQKIIKFIKKQANNKPVVLGLSGGIDSAVIAYLAVKALGNKKIHCLIMPSPTNSHDDLRLAKLVCKNLNLSSIIYQLSTIINTYQKSIKFFKTKQLLGNLKARVRMSLLYAKANELNALVLGTGNKSELLIGYFTKYGDGGADILPIGDLYKTEVKALARYLQIPQEIIDRAPAAGLWAGQTDEKEIGIIYDLLDQILFALEHKKSLNKFPANKVKLVKKMINNSEHKRNLPVICKFRQEHESNGLN